MTYGKVKVSGATVYQLIPSDGKEKNSFSFRVYADKDSEFSEEEIARRMAACWNAYDGISTEALEKNYKQ